jgi:hypothetical protein
MSGGFGIGEADASTSIASSKQNQSHIIILLSAQMPMLTVNTAGSNIKIKTTTATWWGLSTVVTIALNNLNARLLCWSWRTCGQRLLKVVVIKHLIGGLLRRYGWLRKLSRQQILWSYSFLNPQTATTRRRGMGKSYERTHALNAMLLKT